MKEFYSANMLADQKVAVTDVSLVNQMDLRKVDKMEVVTVGWKVGVKDEKTVDYLVHERVVCWENMTDHK